MSEDFLASMAASSRARSSEGRARNSVEELQARAGNLPVQRMLLEDGRFNVIAEVKLRSPALGQLKQAGKEDVKKRVQTYVNAGACAISVLTEPSRFDGSIDDLLDASRALDGTLVPAMRKDFIVDAYQVREARAAGASGILVILRMLPRADLEQIIDAALASKMFVLLEAFDEADIRLAHELVDARPDFHYELLVGVNSRDLVTLKVVPGRLEQLAPLLPTKTRRVAESGVVTPEDCARLARAGYDMALVGGALMSARGPGKLLRAMIEAGRQAALERDIAAAR